MAIPQRTAKRIYSPAALEFWFQKLERDWEPFFRKEALEKGREIYTSGVIREIELSQEDAIIHCKVEKEGFYALIEWKYQNPSFRGSQDDLHFNESVAAAGLYEIEELVADEVTALPPERDGKTHADNGSGNGTASLEQSREVPTHQQDGRRLGIQLVGTDQGLVAEPYWKNGSEKRVPALKKASSVEKAGHTVHEREALVRLTGLAHKAGFRFRNSEGDFVLRDTQKIPRFFNEFLAHWRRVFPIDLDAEARRYQAGVQKVELTARAETGAIGQTMKMHWHLQVGNQILPSAEAFKVARRGRGLTLVPGVGVVEMEAEQAEAIEEWQAFQQGLEESTLPRYMLLSLFAEKVTDLNLEGALESWLEEVDRVGEDPREVPAFLRHYQESGVRWLTDQCELGCHVLLADEMGLGKTLQVLGLIHSRKLKGAYAERPHLIVCPSSVVPVWKNEIHRFFPGLSLQVLKTGHDFASAEVKPDSIWLASYTQLRRHKHLLNDFSFGYAVLDEAQQIKNPDAKVSHACMQIRAVHRLAMTGTPLENRQLDVWTLFRYLMPGLLGSRKRFEVKVAEDLDGEFRARLGAQIQPFILRRTKDQVLEELPPKMEMDLSCPMTDLQVRAYRKLAEEGITTLGDDLKTASMESSMHFFALLTRLRQVCCDPGLLPEATCGPENSGKIQSLLGKVEEIFDNGSKVVIFSQFTGFLDRIRESLEEAYPSVPLFELTGKTRDREKPVKSFQESVGGAAMLISLRAGGVGITLHAADYVFLMDPWWNPAVEAQAIDRVHRLGQENPVFVYRMVTEGTIEERIQALKAEKRGLFQQVVGDMEGLQGIRESFQSLSQLVALDPEEIR